MGARKAFAANDAATLLLRLHSDKQFGKSTLAGDAENLE
jgi:hypothetical protein